MKSGKLLKRCFVTICISVLSLLGVFCAGKNAQALAFPPTQWNIGDTSQSPGLYLNGACYGDAGYSHNQGIYNFWVYPNSNCSGSFNVFENQIIVVELTGYTGFIDLADGAQYVYGYQGIELIGVDPIDTGAGTVYQMYFRGTSNYQGPLRIGIRTTKNGFMSVLSVVSYNYVDSNYSSDLSAILNRLRIISDSVTDVYIRQGQVSSTISTISNNVIDIKGVLDNLGSNLSDIASNSNEENETNKTEKSNIENQTAEDIGNTTDQKTESLMSSFGQFVAVFQSASPSNCRLHIDLGSHSGTNVDFGNVDLCSLPVPSFITIIGSIFLVLAVFAVLYHLINRILSLVREMQS